MKKLIILLIYIALLFASTSNADNNQSKELSEEDKKWIKEYMAIVEEGDRIKADLEKSKKLGKTLDELTNMVKPKK